MIIEGLQHLSVPIEQLNHDAQNARLHDRRNIEEIKKSLLKFGQRAPIVVQREGMVVRAGNARLDAAIELGWKEIAALIIDEADAEAIAYGIADNKTAELATWDYETLADLIKILPEQLHSYTGLAHFEIEPLLEAEWRPPEIDDTFDASTGIESPDGTGEASEPGERDNDNPGQQPGNGGHPGVASLHFVCHPDEKDMILLAIHQYRQKNDDPESNDATILATLCERSMDNGT